MATHLMIDSKALHFNASPLPLGTKQRHLTITGYLRILSGGCSKVGFVCLCTCGKYCAKRGADFLDQISCGCVKKPQGKRGHSWNYKPHLHDANGKRIGTYSTWSAMIQRCKNRKLRGWKDYGGRGIRVCRRWRESFDNFLEDMGERPRGTSLDRIDNDGNYEPSNCRWATRLEQAQNKRTAHIITYAGKTQNLSAWAKDLGINVSTLLYRIDHHGVQEAIRRGGPAGQRDFVTVNRTGLRGVGERNGRFFAQIQDGKRVRSLGTFDRAKDAHQAYLRARKEIDSRAS